MNIPIKSKLPSVGTTIFTVMSGLAAQYNAINLGQGFPDFQMSDELTDLVNKAMKDGFNQYVPMQGYMPLREALAEKAAISLSEQRLIPLHRSLLHPAAPMLFILL